jgi:hypothetical protein
MGAPTAGITFIPPDSDEVTLWILKVYDGDSSEKEAVRRHEYYHEVYPPQSAEKCLVEAERTLRSHYGLSGWVKDPSPSAGFTRSWTRKAS